MSGIRQAIYLIIITTNLLVLTGCIGQGSQRAGREFVNAFVPEVPTPEATPTEEPDEEPVDPLRPTGNSAIQVNSNHCACLNNESVDIGDCDAFCTDRSDPVETLYGSVTPGLSVALEPLFGPNFEGTGTLHGWCNNILPETTSANPSCVLDFEDPSGSVQSIQPAINPGSNDFTANVLQLTKELTYTVRIRETESGATSGPFNVYLTDPTTNVTTFGPLQTVPLHQYNCIARSSGPASNGSGTQFVNAVKVHFYYHNQLEPTPQLPGEESVICHDQNLFPGNDRAEYPRLNLRQNELRLWNRNDIRFQDNGQAYDNLDAANGSADINDEITRRLSLGGSQVPTTFAVYTPFNWPTDPSNRETPPIQGLIMVPWINPTTQRGFCPVQDDYENGDPVFQIIRDLEGGMDTEAVYLAEKNQQPFLNEEGEQDAPDDVIFVTESQLRKIWFYNNANGTKVMADDETAVSRTIRFYWPPKDNGDPLTFVADQEEFIVRAPSEIGDDTISLTQLNTTVQPSDKRFGCVPVTGN